MRERGIERERRHSSANLEWLLHHSDPREIRGRDDRTPLRNKELAHAIGCNEEHVSRMINGLQVAPRYRDAIIQYFKLNVLGCPEGILDWQPRDFARKLRELGYGKFVGADAPEDWLSELTQGTGRFVPDDLLSLLLLRENNPYRGLGLEGDEIREIPNATGVIGRRYGLALEITEPQVEKAVRAGTAYAVLVHRDRSSKLVSLLVSRPNTLVGLLEWLFVRPATSFGPSFALLAERESDDKGTNLGYRIDGTPGRRDLFVFLFAKRPALGAALLSQHNEPRLTKETSEALRAAVTSALLTGAVIGTRLVYDAVSS